MRRVTGCMPHREGTKVDEAIVTVLDALAREHRARVERICRLVDLARRAATAADPSAALSAAAGAVGLSRQTLHGYALVGLRFTNAEIVVLLDQRNSKGEPISLSHLEAVARNARTTQGVLLQQAMGECMTASKLRSTARVLRGAQKAKRRRRSRRG